MLDRARKFASQPAVAAELLRGKAPGSQHVYTSFSGPPPPTAQKPVCKLFAMGKCRFGEKCKFSHSGGIPRVNHLTRARLSSQKNLTCSYCKKTGHSVRRCVSKFLAETAKETPPKPFTRSTALMATTQEAPGPKEEEKTALLPQELEYSFVLSEQKTQDVLASVWILDSGATSSATFSSEDCVDIVDCNVVVSAAGGSFNVTRKGTAKFTILNQDGEPCHITIANTLISEKFPYRLWALQAVTNKEELSRYPASS